MPGEHFDDAKVAVYNFTTIDNNNEEMSSKRYRISRGSKDEGTKFRIKGQNERASLFMQFLILYNRNFKASIRNAVSLMSNIIVAVKLISI